MWAGEALAASLWLFVAYRKQAGIQSRARCAATVVDSDFLPGVRSEHRKSGGMLLFYFRVGFDN